MSTSTDALKLTLGVTYIDPAELPDVARIAEEYGFHAVALADHVAMPAARELQHALVDKDRRLFDSAGPWPDALVAIAAMAAVTSRLRFLTRVIVVPLVHPLALARAAATVAVISGGRLDLGIGAGWMREEFDVMGARFERRGALADEALEILGKAWAGPFEHRGRFHAWPELSVTPRPPVPVPIYVGGNSEAAYRRAIRFGTGYLSRATDLGAMRAELESLARVRAAAGVPGACADFVARAGADWGPREFESAIELGATSAVVVPWGAGGPPAGLAAKRRVLEGFAASARTMIRP